MYIKCCVRTQPIYFVFYVFSGVGRMVGNKGCPTRAYAIHIIISGDKKKNQTHLTMSLIQKFKVTNLFECRLLFLNKF